jgi:hypothetical protein
MNSFLRLWLKNWLYFVGAAVIGVGAFAFIHIFFNPLEVETVLISNSRLGERVSQMTWDIDQPGAHIDAHDKHEIKDLSLWLKSFDFMNQFITENCRVPQAPDFCKALHPEKESAALQLIRMVDTRIDDDKVMNLKVRGSSAETAAALANALAAALVKLHDDQSQQDVERFERSLAGKKSQLESRMRSSLQILSKDGVGSAPYSYLSDLQSKASEIDLKLSENKRAIQLFKEQSAKGSDYGPILAIEKLRTENKLLTSTKKTIEDKIKRAVSKQYLTPDGATSLTQLQEQSRVDLESYASVTRAIERIKLIAAVQNMNLEILQRASPILAKTRFPFALLIGLGLFLSQFFAGVTFMILNLWKENGEKDWHPSDYSSLSNEHDAKDGKFRYSRSFFQF